MSSSIERILSIGEFDDASYRKGWITPRKDVFPGLRFSFSGDQFLDDPELSHRLETTPDGLRYLVADARNQGGHWFSLEVDISARVSHCLLRVKAYPLRRIFPKIYYDAPVSGVAGPVDSHTVDLPDIAIFEEFSNLRVDLPDLPEGTRNVRLALHVPDADWFVLGFDTMKAYADA